MKRFRVKLVGLGCALLTGAAVAADGQWQPAGRSTPTPVVPIGSAVRPAQFEIPVAPAAQPVQPAVLPAPTPIEPAWQPITPRVGVATPEPPFPKANVLPQPSAVVQQEQPNPIPPIPQIPPDPPGPKPVPPKLMVPPIPLAPDHLPLPQPKPPEMIPPELPGSLRPVLPQPTPAVPGELPVAPPELMIPAGAIVPGMHGTFGSKPINLSRDFPTIRDMWDALRGDVREHISDRRSERQARRIGSREIIDERDRGYVQAEYLMWWATPMGIPVLGTTNTLGGFGFLGEPGTVPILGPGEIIGSQRAGFRTRAGMWLGQQGKCGIDGGFFFLDNKTNTILLTSDVFPIITRPIFSPNPVAGGGVIGETGEAVTVPGILTGGLAAHAESSIWGFDTNIRKCLHNCCTWQAEWFFGYRNVNMDESLSITEHINVIGPGAGRVTIPDPVGSVVVVQDSFRTHNSFNGAQIGLFYERQAGRMFFNSRASIALGATHQELTINGYQIRTQPGMAPMTFTGGGLLAAGPNIGTFTRNEFSVVSEVTLNAGFRVSSGLRVYVGYNMLYWSNVIRPGDQIDNVVDLTFVPNAPPATPSGLARPAALFRQSDLWLSGIQFGAQWIW